MADGENVVLEEIAGYIIGIMDIELCLLVILSRVFSSDYDGVFEMLEVAAADAERQGGRPEFVEKRKYVPIALRDALKLLRDRQNGNPEPRADGAGFDRRGKNFSVIIGGLSRSAENSDQKSGDDDGDGHQH